MTKVKQSKSLARGNQRVTVNKKVSISARAAEADFRAGVEHMNQIILQHLSTGHFFTGFAHNGHFGKPTYSPNKTKAVTYTRDELIRVSQRNPRFLKFVGNHNQIQVS